MLYKLSAIQEDAPDGSGYNDPPFNFKPMTEEQFAQSGFRSQGIEAVEFRQMFVNGKMVEARLFWFTDATGVAISSDYWKGKVQYYSFGCNHKLEAKSYKAGESYHCSKCNTDVHEPWMDLIVSDSGWSMNEGTSIPSRGIRDYERTIRFKSALDSEQIKKVVLFLKKTDCPGWTGVGVKDMGEGLLFRFSTTYDSSD